MQLIILDADYQYEMSSPQRRNIIRIFLEFERIE